MPVQNLITEETSRLLNPQTQSPRGRVLIVDDEEQNRLLLRDPLEAHGYEIIEAENGEEALQAVSSHQPDVILLDVMMPGLDGFEVCRKLKSNIETAAIPVLMVTALSERKERMMGVAAGANDFLNKPVDIQDVTLRVRNAVSSKRLFDQLQAEKQRSEELLLNILPRPIAERMRNGEETIADSFPEVTVLVADLVGFGILSAHLPPEQVVYLLNEIFSAFDSLVERHGLEKIKTVGDAYIVAAGIPCPRPDHAEAMAKLAIQMQTEIQHFNKQYETAIQIRIGISTGPVVAGVIGRKKFAYDLWGEAIDLAGRLESLGEPGSIQVSESSYEQLKGKFRFASNTTFEIPGGKALNAYTISADKLS